MPASSAFRSTVLPALRTPSQKYHVNAPFGLPPMSASAEYWSALQAAQSTWFRPRGLAFSIVPNLTASREDRAAAPALGACDVIATPTTPTPAFRLGEKTGDPLQMYLADIFTVPANLAGLPALSIPCGLASGLPVGLQLLGRSFDEATLLRAGAAYQRATRHHELAPPV